MFHRRRRITEPMDRILPWAVQSQSQRKSIGTELSPDRHRVRPPHPSQRSGGCRTITEEREISWSRQHPSRTGSSRYRGRNHCSHDNLQQILADRKWPTPWTQSLVTTLPPKMAICSSARTTEWSASSVTQAKSCWRSYWTDWRRKWRRSSLKNRQASEQEGAPRSRFSTYEFSVRNISSTSKTSTMSQ